MKITADVRKYTDENSYSGDDLPVQERQKATAN